MHAQCKVPVQCCVLKPMLLQVWRMPYNMEGLMYDSTTYNPLTDTEPGFQDGSGSNVGNGPFFRHNRACSSSNPCNQVFAVYRDNCWADRTLSFNSVTGVFELSVCVDNDGNPAYLDPVTRVRQDHLSRAA